MEAILAEKIFSFLKEIHDDFQPLSTKLNINIENTRHLVIASIYGSIIELSGSIILLREKNIISSIPVLLRSLLEAHIDLVNLIQDSEYINYLKASFIHEWLKIYTEAKRNKNEYLAEISNLPDLEKRIMHYKKSKENLNESGYKSLRIEDKFKVAKFENEYQSIYNSLCCDSHNNLRALFGRHIKLKKAKIHAIEVYRHYSLEESMKYISITAVTLLRSAEFTHEFFKSTTLQEVSTYREKFDIIHAEVSRIID